MKKGILIVFIAISACPGYGQDLSNIRTRSMVLSGDSIRIDSLSIIPGSLRLYYHDESSIADSLYETDYARSLLLPDSSLRNREISVLYRTFPISFSSSYQHKKHPEKRSRNSTAANPFRLTSEDLKYQGFYSQSELNKRGSLSRGIVFGNNQDVVVNSNLNLQLSGKLSEDLNVVAAISDNNIPIQPEGYSQQIQEFDQVYITLYNDQMKLTAGDFVQTGAPGPFLRFTKKAKGANYSGTFRPGNAADRQVKTTFSAAIAKGRFCRNQFQGTEGNQGPYRLRGCNREQFIIVLAGSEKVFIDGKILRRGLENDYVIDYNTAEITFTPQQLITKDKRIIVEFEYAERSYARFLVYNSNEYLTGKGRIWLNIYSESDDKNQTLQQNLREEDKDLLRSVGDRIDEAVIPRTDSVGFNNSEVLYRKLDTTVQGISYPSVYAYSTNPDSAFYRLRFSYTGVGQGNYKPVNTSANGKVYRWIAPVNGSPQGSYEPVVLLVTPKKKQVVTTGGEGLLGTATRVKYEFAVSNNDINTFSDLDNDDNPGFAARLGLDRDLLAADTSRLRLKTGIDYQFLNSSFDPVERFRPVEFERDWNLAETALSGREHLLSLYAGFFRKETGRINYQGDLLDRGKNYSALKNNLAGSFSLAGFRLDMNGSLLHSEGRVNDTRFIRHDLTLSRNIADLFVVGLGEMSENNRWVSAADDSLLPNSFRFAEYEAFLTQPDSSQNEFLVSYKQRKDYSPQNNHLALFSTAEDYRASFRLLNLKANRLGSSLTYRRLEFSDSLAAGRQKEQNLLGRLEHALHLWKNAFSTSTFYEIGTGLEARKEYAFVEVAPGQGIYTWSDYNNNGVRELDEFEVSRFQDEARFIRIFIPSDDYITIYTNRFNQALNIDPVRIWKDRGGIRQWASYFSNQFAYRLDRKNTANNFLRNANPFVTDLNDPNLVTIATSIRNSLSFNRLSKIFSADYLYHVSKNRILLANGFDTRIRKSNGLRIRWSLTPDLSLSNQTDAGRNEFNSEFFSSRNYRIDFYSNNLKLQYQPGISTRFSLNYQLADRLNMVNADRARENTIGTGIRYGIPGKGTLKGTFDYILINYEGETNTPASYEMLQALLPGKNAAWSVLFQRAVAGGIELNIEYSGRVSENQDVIHTGGLQVRAVF